MTIKKIKIIDLQKQGRVRLLEKLGANLAALETDLILGQLLKKNRIELMLDANQDLEEEVEEAFSLMLEERQKGRPMAYLLGHKEFMGYDFRIKEGVLIPRDDTEVVLAITIEALSEKEEQEGPQVFKGLELGIGTGIISLILLEKFKNLQMIGLDINPLALENSRENTSYLEEQTNHRIGDRFEIIESDLLSALDAEEESLDFLVSNPPYIESKTIEELEDDVKNYEPHLALDGGEDGLDFYRAILKEGLPYLKKQGFVAFEIGYNQGPAMVKMMEDYGLERILLEKDLAGKDRGIIGFKK